MKRAVLVLLAGCNHFYELDPTTLANDARSFTCPAIGETPQFSRDLRQIVSRACDAYSTRGTQATAVCTTRDETDRYAREVVIGPAESEDLTSATGIPLSTTDEQIRAAHLGGDGRIYVHITGGPVRAYRRTGETWQLDEEITAGGVVFAAVSSIATVDGRDRFLALPSGSQDRIYELVAPSWTMTEQLAADVGVADFRGITLTSDGTRMVFIGGQSPSEVAMYFTDRMTAGTPFRRATMIDVPRYYDPFMSDDCGRIYVSGVGSVFFTERL